MEPEVLANIDTTQPVTPALNIDTGTAPPQPPSDAVAQTRAYKAHMGLGDIVKQNYSEIYRNISDGKEDALRRDAAMTITAKAMEDQQQALIKLAAEKGRNLTLADVQQFDPTPADPKSVIERSYATAYLNTLNNSAARIDDNILTTARQYMDQLENTLGDNITDSQAKNPDLIQQYFNKGSEVLSKREYALQKEQNLQPEVEANRWFNVKDPNGQEHNLSSHDIKNLLSFGFYDELKLRGNTDKTSRFAGLGLGENLDYQARELLDLPFPEFQRKFDTILDNLKKSEPELAQKFAHYVGGVSTSDKYIDDAMTAVNLAIGKGLVGAARGALKSAGERQVASIGRRADGAADQGGLVQGADGVYRKPATTGTDLTVVQAQKAVEDVVKSANVPEVTKASIAEGAGDVKEAGVQKAITSVVTRPDPEKDAVDTLFSMHRADTEAARNAPGNLSREEHTRIINAAESFEKAATDVIINTTKVVRTPLAAEDGFRAIADRIKDYFPGRENTIADVTVRYEPASNTYHHDIKIVNYDATPFSSYDLAASHARINGYDLSGIEGKAGDKLYIPAAAAKNLESVKTTPEGTRFYVTHGIEVDSSAVPLPSHIPYNLKTGKFEKALDEETAHIEQQGLGFHIIVTKPLDETQSFIRDGLIGAAKAKSTSNIDTPRSVSIGNAVLGYLRNPYDTLSTIENENRSKVVFSQSKFLQLAKEEMRHIEDLYKGLINDGTIMVQKPLSYGRSITGANKVIWDQFERSLVASQTMDDPKTGLPGYFMKTPAEIQHFWQSTFRRPASFKEQQSYLAIGRLDHFDHILRQVSEYRNKARLGVEQWTFDTVKDGQTSPSVTFDARQIKDVKGGEDVTLIHDVNGSEKFWDKMNPKAQAEFREAVKQGKYTGVEIYDTEKRPIYRVDTEGNALRIRYVFSNAMKSKPITYDQIGYRGGGHWEYDYDHAVKQSIVRRQWVGGKAQDIYEGDSTFGFVSNRAMGEDFAKHMNEIARLIRDKQYKDAKDYSKKVFDIEWKKLYAGFKPSKNPVTNEVLPPRFSTDPRQEFRVVPKGKTIFDLDDNLEEKYTRTNVKTGAITKTFIDGTRHGSLARNFQVQYSGARESYDLPAPTNVGSTAAPFYEFRPAQLTDPITTMTRAMTRIVNSIYMDDYKISAAEHWLQENMGLLEASKSEIRASPFYYFNEGKFKNNPDTILARLNAESNRYKIKQLIGTPSKIDTVIQGIKQTISDSLYEAGRDSLVNKIDNKLADYPKTGKVIKAPLIAPEWMLDRIHNPVDFFRGMVFHKYLGLFNWVQVVTQNLSYATIYALSPTHAIQGSFGALMHQWSRVNKSKSITTAMDVASTNFGWKLGELSEAMRILDRTGMGSIGNEMSLDNGLHKQSFFRHDGKAFLDAGQVFFNAANRNVRFGAWYTAFHEFRTEFPFKKIGPVEEGQILRRANDLNTNMTRDANTMLNKGIVGVTLQFFDFQKKLGDLFYSKRIGETLGQRSLARARMFLVYAMLYGAVGATGLSLIPGGDIVRKKALEAGYVMGEKVWSTLLMEGPLSMVGAYLTGKGDMQKGTFYNFNDRFGANGYQILRDMMQTDVTFYKVILGAVGTDIGNTLASLSGFTNAMYSMATGDPAKEAWPLKIDDWNAPLKTVSSWKYGDRLRYALAFGKWLDSHGRPTSDVSKIDAIFRTLIGVTDQRVDDMYLRTLTKKDEKAAFDRAFNTFEEESRKAEQAASNGDKQQADDYNKRAFFALTSKNVPIELWAKALQRRAVMNRDLIEKNNESYYLQYVPTNRQDAALEAYKKIQQMKDK